MDTKKMDYTAVVIPMFKTVKREDPTPRVFNEKLVANLAAMNSALRWLRQNGIEPISSDYTTAEPTVVVPATAGPLLVRKGKGLNSRQLRAGESHCYIFIDGCEVCWTRQEDV
jgi:hypothetical protein